MIITILVVMSRISLNLGLIKRQDYEKKRKKKREDKENLLRSPLYMHIPKERNSSAIDHSIQGSMLTKEDTSKMTRCSIGKFFLCMVNDKVLLIIEGVYD
jgi:hypothetical protein